MSDDDNIFREVDAELRSERYAELWDKYGILVIGIGLAIILGVAGTKGYEAYQKSQVETAGAKFVEAAAKLEDKSDVDAEKALKSLAASGPEGYRILARLRLAGAAIKAGKTDEAVKLYDEVAASASVERLIRDFARLQAATLRLDKADWTETENRLNKLITPDGAWRHSAREMLAVAAINAGKYEDAEKALLQALGDRGTPITMRQRLEVLTQIATAKSAAAGLAAKKDKKPDADNKDVKPDSDTGNKSGSAEKSATQ